MVSIREFLISSYRHFKDSSHVTQKDIQYITAFVLKLSREDLFLFPDGEVSKTEENQIDELLLQKASGMPLAYILGYVDFYGCRLSVNPSVLIPRVETELLLDFTLKEVEGRSLRSALDLCSGSGALGIALKKARPELDVYLVDISEKALDTARSNAKQNGVDVVCLRKDLYEGLEGIPKLDLVLCNPPYISESEWEGLETSVKDFEPKIALSSGKTGLEIFENLSYSLPQYLNPGALVVFEIGAFQKEDIIKIFSKKPWKFICCKKDLASLDRCIFLEVE